jgi:hypothetical protein
MVKGADVVKRLAYGSLIGDIQCDVLEIGQLRMLLYRGDTPAGNNHGCTRGVRCTRNTQANAGFSTDHHHPFSIKA